MAQDEVQPRGWRGGTRPATTAAMILRIGRLSDEETANPSLFATPSRLQVARRRLVNGLHCNTRQGDPSASNDN